MYPVIFSIGSLSVSTFGVFLALAFLLAVFVGWRLGKIYDIDEEKVLDLVILSFFGGMIGARLLFVIFNLGIFDTIEKIVLVNRYPGLSFWGGLLGGLLTLSLLSGRFKITFWQLLDFAAVGLALGIIIGDIGCFFGGCEYGVVSNLPIAMPVVGLIGNRLPISLFEALVLLPVFSYLWGQTIHFHFQGKIAALFMMILGLIKFITEYYRGDSHHLPYFGNFSYGHVFALALFIFGVVVFYLRSRRNLISDISNFAALFYSAKKRKQTLLTLRKTWYNHKTKWRLGVSKTGVTLKTAPRLLKRRLNVKSTPTNLS